jgi:hypothetical protein
MEYEVNVIASFMAFIAVSLATPAPQAGDPAAASPSA